MHCTNFRLTLSKLDRHDALTVTLVAARIALVASTLGGLASCSSSSAGECTIGADCASGVCGEDGQCAASGADGGPGADAADDAGPLRCTDGIDGVLESSELPLQPGARAVFRTAQDIDFDTRPSEQGGETHWDLSGAFAGDQDEELVLLDPSEHWSSELFPTASYMAPLASDSDLLGVFELRDDGLFLLGVVSPEEGFARTELEYDPPALLLSLPAMQGTSWQSDSSISGLAQGVISVYSETYSGRIDHTGSAETPFGEFQVLRSQVELVRTIGLVTTTVQQHSLFAECAGSVASIRSQDDESESDFSEVAELRRLAP